MHGCMRVHGCMHTHARAQFDVQADAIKKAIPHVRMQLDNLIRSEHADARGPQAAPSPLLDPISPHASDESM